MSRVTVRPVPRRRALAAAMVAALGLTVAACSSGATGTSDASSPAPSEGSSSPEAGGSEAGAEDLSGEITFAWWGDASRADRYQEAIELFTSEHPEVNVLTQYAGWGDYWTARNTEAAGSALPDVIQMDLAYLAEYAGTGRLLELDSFEDEGVIDVSTIAPTLLPSGQVDGVTYAIPTSSSTLATVINETMLDDLGIAVPTGDFTWESYEAFLAEVTAAGSERSPVVYGSLDYTQVFWLFAIWLEQQGTSLISPDGGIGFTKEQMAEWWERGVALQDAGDVVPMARQTQLEADAIGMREVAADISWSNFLVRFSEGAEGDTLSLLPVPSDDPDDLGLFLKPGVMLSAAANTEHPEVVGAFIDFITNDARVGEIFGMSRGLPASSEALAGVSNEGLDAKIIEFSDELAPRITHDSPVSVRGFSTMEGTFTSLAQDVSYGVLDVEAAVDEWFAEAEMALG